MIHREGDVGEISCIIEESPSRADGPGYKQVGGIQQQVERLPMSPDSLRSPGSMHSVVRSPEALAYPMSPGLPLDSDLVPLPAFAADAVGSEMVPLHRPRGELETRQHTHNNERSGFRRQNTFRSIRGSHYTTSSHHNHVDINRIREGTDVRTTASFDAPTQENSPA